MQSILCVRIPPHILGRKELLSGCHLNPRTRGVGPQLVLLTGYHSRGTGALPPAVLAGFLYYQPPPTLSHALSFLSLLVDEHERDVTYRYHEANSRGDIIPARW